MMTAEEKCKCQSTYWNVYVVSDDVTQIVYYRMLMTFGLQKEKEGESESYIYILPYAFITRR